MPEDRTVAALVAALEGAELLRGDPGVVLSAVEYDSRQVGTGGLFVAIKGFNTDGHNYIAAAVEAGAAAILVQAERAALVESVPAHVAAIAVADSRRALSRAAAWFYGFPSRELLVVGVTGTDGKTTTCHMLTSIFEAAGHPTARLCTVDVHLPGEDSKLSSRMSTPEAPELHRILRRAVEARAEVAVVESTSHGLALHRLDDVDYDIAVLTNVTGDHMDFHETFEAYREAKALLFAALDRSSGKGVQKGAVVNGDDPSGNFMLAKTTAPALRYGFEGRDLDISARNVHLRPDGSSFRLITPVGHAEITIALPALFNVANALAAAAAAVASGIALPAIAEGLGALTGVPGRMERIDQGQPFEVIIDYAHTGDAVRKALEVLREVSKGRLIIVIGAAGERDPGRRFGVGRAAAEGADFAVFTSEDPRSEDPAAIIREIARHAESAGRVAEVDFTEIVDRREAITVGMMLCHVGDTVLICGKGHEQSMIFGADEIPWDDRQVAREQLAFIGFPGPSRVQTAGNGHQN